MFYLKKEMFSISENNIISVEVAKVVRYKYVVY